MVLSSEKNDEDDDVVGPSVDVWRQVNIQPCYLVRRRIYLPLRLQRAQTEPSRTQDTQQETRELKALLLRLQLLGVRGILLCFRAHLEMWLLLAGSSYTWPIGFHGWMSPQPGEFVEV